MKRAREGGRAWTDKKEEETERRKEIRRHRHRRDVANGYSKERESA